MTEPAALWGGIRLYDTGLFPLSTDSILLADFLPLPSNGKIVDLGSGCGTLGLLLCGRSSNCTVTGIELQEASHLAALENIRQNHLQSRLTSVLGDLRDIRRLLPQGQFDCAVSNPPYFPQNSGAAGQGASARMEDCCTPEDLFSAARWLVRYGGTFCLVHRPERLTDLLVAARNADLEPKKLRFVRHKPDAPVNLVLLQCKHGGRPGLELQQDLILWNPDGTATAEQNRIYHR